MQSRFEQFAYVISGINRYILKLQRDEMEKYGYRGAFAQYLTVLERHPEGMTCAALCRLCDKDKAAVSRIVGEMEQKGLVTRQGNNRRLYRATVVLTDVGQVAARYVRERARAAVNAIDPAMSEEERRILYSLLDRIASKLQSMSRDGIPEQE